MTEDSEVEEAKVQLGVPENEEVKRQSMTVQRVHTSIFLNLGKAKSKPPGDTKMLINPTHPDKKQASSHIGMVLGRSSQEEAQMSQDELREAQIIDWLYKAFTQDSSHHLMFNEDLIQIALFCLEYCQDISIDVKRKIARLISVSTLIQERLMTKEIIMGISHLLGHKEELEMISHTTKALSYMSMKHEFWSSPLSVEIMKKLIELIPILKDKELHILLITISNIMNGREDNKSLFFDSKPCHLLPLLEQAQQVPEQKDFVIGVWLITKELFNNPSILTTLKQSPTFKPKLEQFLIFLFTLTTENPEENSDSSIFNEENLPIKLDEAKLESKSINKLTFRVWV